MGFEITNIHIKMQKSTADGQKLKVCIVEDEPLIQEMYKDKFEHDGFDVSTASDGEEGLGVIKKEKPDIILTDLMMPNQDGISMMKRLRQDPSFSKTPVVILTNLDNSETAEKTSDFNAAFYLVKSRYSPSEVANIVKEILASQYKIMA